MQRPKFRPRHDRRYLLFFKPYGVLSQFRSERGVSEPKPTLAGFEFPPDVYPVGRLDHDSEGLLLLSDDPAITAALIEPRRQHERTYLAQVEGIPTNEAIASLEAGVVVQGRMTLPARARLLTQQPSLPERPVPIRERKQIPTSWIELTLTEGRNRQVRRMTAAVGYPTLRLVRVAIGRLDLAIADLQPGSWRQLTMSEVELLFQRRDRLAPSSTRPASDE